MIKEEVKICQVNQTNYYKYEDMIYWRINKEERTYKMKQLSQSREYISKIKELRHEGFYVFAAEYEARFIGWIHLMYVPKIGKWKSGVLYVDELWVAPKYRKNGVAYKLMEKGKEIQNGLKASRMRLCTNNPAAQKLYEKCDFIVKNECVFMETQV